LHLSRWTLHQRIITKGLSLGEMSLVHYYICHVWTHGSRYTFALLTNRALQSKTSYRVVFLWLPPAGLITSAS